jgi:hypothetical protein
VANSVTKQSRDYSVTFALILAVFLIELFLSLSASLNLTRLTPFLSRDLSRAGQLFQGAFPLGSETYQGSYTHLPMFYWLLNPISYFYKDTLAVMSILVVLLPISILLLSKIFSQASSTKMALVYAICTLFVFPNAFPANIDNSFLVVPLTPLFLFWILKFDKPESRSMQRNWIFFSMACISLSSIHQSILYFLIFGLHQVARISTRPKFIGLYYFCLTALTGAPFIAYYLLVFFDNDWAAIFARSNFSYTEALFQRIMSGPMRIFESDLTQFYMRISHRDRIELVILLLFSLYFWLREKPRASSFIYNLNTVNLVLLVINFGWLIQSPHRYIYIFALISLFVFATFFADKIQKSHAALTLLLGLMIISIPLKFYYLNWMYVNSRSQEFTFKDGQKACALFNQLGLSAIEVKTKLYEITDKENTTSLNVISNCLTRFGSLSDLVESKFYYFIAEKREMNRNDISSAATVIPTFLLKKTRYSEKELLFENEKIAVYRTPQNKVQSPILESGNLANIYDLDPFIFGRSPINLSLNQLAKSFEPTELYHGSFCEDPFFCGVFISSGMDKNGRRFLLLQSRPLQTRQILAPYTILLRNSYLSLSCNNKVKKIELPEEIGSAQLSEGRPTLLLPIVIHQIEQCDYLADIKLTIAKIESNSINLRSSSETTIYFIHSARN